MKLWDLSRRPMPDVYLLRPVAGELVDRTCEGELVAYDRHPLRAALEVYRAGPRVQGAVGRIACPTLVLHGRRDGVCSWRNAGWLTQHLGTRDATVNIYDHSAHVLAWDGDRRDVARDLVQFLDRRAHEAGETSAGGGSGGSASRSRATT
jgi:esterase/lipase